jgi:23S rRNA (guanosine2251-2'-O)-methyltransferase
MPGAGGARPSGIELIYGRNPVREALRGRRQVYAVWLAAGEAGEELERALPGWCAAGPDCGHRPVPALIRCPAAELSARLRTGEHQNIAAEVDPYPYLDPEGMLQRCSLLVALDEVQDPHNLGAIIRTAEGVGAGVIIPRHRAAEVTAAVVKASAGASEHAAVGRVRNLADFLESAKQAGFWVYGAAAGAGSLYTAQDYRYPTCFVVGSEGEGLGRRVASLCDVMVGLPLAGKVDSLNVSVSAGVLLYEAIRQRMVQAGDGLDRPAAKAGSA